MQSCAAQRQAVKPVPCEGEIPVPFTPARTQQGWYIVGKARIELPRYRIRGVANIRYSPTGGLRIDFHHSSLFGAVREEASVFVRGDSVCIYDREGGRLFGRDSSLAILRQHFLLEIRPDDLVYALLLKAPSCSEFGSLNLEASGEDWVLEGRWRSRDVKVSGTAGEGPTRFSQCSDDGEVCYTIRYLYGRDGGYPEKLILTRENGPERVSFEIREIREELFSPGHFVY